jgi:hypothetical protein
MCHRNHKVRHQRIVERNVTSASFSPEFRKHKFRKWQIARFIAHSIEYLSHAIVMKL